MRVFACRFDLPNQNGQWFLWNLKLSAYSCGGSAGFSPTSLFTPFVWGTNVYISYMIKFYESQKILSHIIQQVDPIELNTRDCQSSIEATCQRPTSLVLLFNKRYIITYQVKYITFRKFEWTPLSTSPKTLLMKGAHWQTNQSSSFLMLLMKNMKKAKWWNKSQLCLIIRFSIFPQKTKSKLEFSTALFKKEFNENLCYCFWRYCFTMSP